MDYNNYDFRKAQADELVIFRRYSIRQYHADNKKSLDVIKYILLAAVLLMLALRIIESIDIAIKTKELKENIAQSHAMYEGVGGAMGLGDDDLVKIEILRAGLIATYIGWYKFIGFVTVVALAIKGLPYLSKWMDYKTKLESAELMLSEVIMTSAIEDEVKNGTADGYVVEKRYQIGITVPGSVMNQSDMMTVNKHQYKLYEKDKKAYIALWIGEDKKDRNIELVIL